MTRPRRASTARVRTRSPLPRRALLWTIDAHLRHDDHHLTPIHRWTCLLCESGTGHAPTHQQADQGAAAHWRAVHSNEEEL